METKEKIIKILKDNVKREGIDRLLFFLEESDYYEAPASIQYHSNEKGGLAEHSLSVYNILKEKNDRYGKEYSEETIAIVGLLHDVCKINFYKEKEFEPATPAQLNYLKSLSKTDFSDSDLSKDAASKLIEQYKGTKPTSVKNYNAPLWVVDDQLPIGHGEKSIFVIQKYIDLLDDEAMAIRWHMAAFDAGIHFNYPSGFPFRQACDKCKLVVLTFTSDYESDKILNI